MKIINEEELKERIAEYQQMFPETAISYQDIVELLLRNLADRRSNGVYEGLFGFSVSPEWEDKCYSFEFRGFTGILKEPTYEFMGMFKC